MLGRSDTSRCLLETMYINVFGITRVCHTVRWGDAESCLLVTVVGTVTLAAAAAAVAAEGAPVAAVTDLVRGCDVVAVDAVAATAGATYIICSATCSIASLLSTHR